VKLVGCSEKLTNGLPDLAKTSKPAKLFKVYLSLYKVN